MISITEEQRKELFADSGFRKAECYVNVIKGGVVIATTGCEGTVDLDTTAAIERSAQLTINQKYDWLSVELQPFFRIGSTDYPLGIFIPSTMVETASAVLGKTWTIDCYDRTLLLMEDKLVDDVTYEAGEIYTDIVKSLLQSAKAGDVLEESESDLTLPTARTFQRGTDKLTIINTLLMEINFDKMRCNENGTFILKKYKLPEMADRTIVYEKEKSVVLPGYERTEEYFDVPNIFFVDASHPELDESYHAEYENTNPADPLSTARRMRNIVVQLSPPENVSSQEQLDEWLERKVFELSSAHQTLTINTIAMPIHGAADQIQIKLGSDDIDGLYVETAWSLTMAPAGLMRHVMRRLG